MAYGPNFVNPLFFQFLYAVKGLVGTHFMRTIDLSCRDHSTTTDVVTAHRRETCACLQNVWTARSGKVQIAYPTLTWKAGAKNKTK